jgi:RNA polymerase sigma-70 factor, ECF subfamily
MNGNSNRLEDCVVPDHPGESLEGRSDHSLLRRLRKGEEDAATVLYLRYVQRLRGLTNAQCSAELARQVETDDILQSVFLSFFRKAASGLYDVPEGEELWNLLLVITINKIRAKGKFHHAARRDVRKNIGAETLETIPINLEEDEQALAELHMVIDEILVTLPNKSAQIVELRIAGHEISDIARQTGRSHRTVERTLQEFRHQLRNHL